MTTFEEITLDTIGYEYPFFNHRKKELFTYINTIKNRKKDSSEINVDEKQDNEILQTSAYTFDQLKEMGKILKDQKISDVSELVTEYISHERLELFHSIIDIGTEFFKDARPRNELEAKIINSFLRSKSKILPIKDIK